MSSRTCHRTLDFDEWASQLSTAVGHHRSRLLTPEIPFTTAMEVIESGRVRVLRLEGTSSLALHRHQPEPLVVLWLPQHGWVEETVNGLPIVAEPGEAMLCLPGDELRGVTSPYLKGISVVLPADLLGPRSQWQGVSQRLIGRGPEAVTTIQMIRDIAGAVQETGHNVELLLASLADQLLFWRDGMRQPTLTVRRPSVARRRLLRLCHDWIEAHLATPFRMADLADALHVSSRTLQYCFSEELGRSPLLEVRRLRLAKLRQQLLSPAAAHEPLADLFSEVGLTDSRLSRMHYRHWCGETPEQTLRRAARADSPSAERQRSGSMQPRPAAPLAPVRRSP